MRLPNGARCSEIAVHPKNWKSSKAKLSVDWYISYRYYNAAKKCKQVTLRTNIKEYSTIPERQKIVRDLIAQELDLLLNRGYNPITNTFLEEAVYEIHPSTPMFTALWQALDKLICPKPAKDSIKSVLNILQPIAAEASVHLLPVDQVKRRHIKMILEKAEKERKLSPTNYNHYRAYLMMLFKELVTMEAIESNPVTKELPKRKIVKKARLTLTKAEREKVNQHLYKKYYTFWRYLQIFFHSGARTAELFRLKVKDVDTVNQRYKVVIRKGRDPVEVWKIIKNSSLPLWKEVLIKAAQNDFVFSVNLEPGKKSIRPDQITKRWYKHVKVPSHDPDNVNHPLHGLNIKADFYSLKHTHTTEISNLLSQEEAAKHNSHTSTAMVVKIYDVNHEERENEKLKQANNTFA